MKPRSVTAGLVGCILLAAAPAGAAPIQRSFEAVLALHSTLVPPVYLSGTGVATLDVTGDHVDGLSLPAAIFATQVTAATGGVEVRVDATNGAGVFTAASGPWTGSMPVLGTLRICLGGSCDGSPLADVSLPLDVVGAGGTTTASSGAFVVSGAPWQTATLVLAGTGFVSNFSGYQSGPAGGTSSTALPGGFMLFVTPVHVAIPGFGGIDFVGELGVTFVPEPGALALAASGLAGCAALGASGRRSSARRARPAGARAR